MDRRDQLLLGSIWNKKKTPECCGISEAGPSIISYISSDFDVDGTTVHEPDLVGKAYEIFLNEINRFIYNGSEWDYVSGGGFEVLLPGFDASSNDYHLYLFIK